MQSSANNSDFIHQIGKVPVPLKLGKLLKPKAWARASKTRGGESTRVGWAPLLLGGYGGPPPENF